MSRISKITVPDIGDFKEVEVIEVLVRPGERVGREQSLVTLESDKATMEIPSPDEGIVRAIELKVGDRVSQGSLILTMETAGAAGMAGPPAPPAGGEATVGPALSASMEAAATAAQVAEGSPYDCDVVVLGAGPGGYSAAFRAADLGLRTILVERHAALGGVCLNVGCIPSKALLHTMAVTDAARELALHGVAFDPPRIDLAKLRAFKEGVVARLAEGIAAMARMRKVTVLRGNGRFEDRNLLKVETPQGAKTLRFAHAIIAAGSEATRLPFLPEDPRIVDSTGALSLPFLPRRMLVIGGGIIGLEMGTVYSSLGARLDVVEMLEGLMPGTDRDLVAIWQKKNRPRFDHVWLGARTTRAEALPEGIRVSFEGGESTREPQLYDLVLVSVGRRPNGRQVGAEAAGVTVDERGFVTVDSQMRTNVSNIYAIGDIAGAPMLAHKAVHEGHVAAEAIAGHKSHFDARVIPAVAYTDPEIAWVGVTEDEAKRDGRSVGIARFPWTASGRAIANARDEGQTKLLFDPETHRVIGGAIVGTGAGDLIGEIALAIEMGADATDIGRTIHPHPTLGESIGMAAELYEGVCTDLPPTRRS